MEDLIRRAAGDLVKAKYAIALTGAGISTESGIHDFRGPDGIWTKHPEAEMEAYEAYDHLRRDPKKHWENILAPGSFFSLFDEVMNALPNRGHLALAELEAMGILKLVITQNVDSLHEKAGSRNVIEYHGGVSKLRCMSCNTRYKREQYDLEQLKAEDKLPPRCRKCNGVVKHDGVYFGEAIPSDVAQASLEAASQCDLMLICGTSAVVYPFAQLPRIAREKGAAWGSSDWGFPRAGKPTGFATAGDAPASAPSGNAPRSIPAGKANGSVPSGRATQVNIIEINAEPTPLTHEGISDYIILGKTGDVLPGIVAEVKKRMKG